MGLSWQEVVEVQHVPCEEACTPLCAELCATVAQLPVHAVFWCSPGAWRINFVAQYQNIVWREEKFPFRMECLLRGCCPPKHVYVFVVM